MAEDERIISTLDVNNEQKTQQLDPILPTSNNENPNIITSPDSARRQNSRKKVQDFINAHRSRALSSRRASKPNERSNDKTPSEKTAIDDGKRSPNGSKSTSSSKKRLSFFKQSLGGSSSKRNRAYRQQVSVEKPISVHPMPVLDEEKPLQQMAVAHVVVKTKLNHKELEAAMRKRNQCYRFWSIVMALITVSIIFILMSINVYAIWKIWEMYILISKEQAFSLGSSNKTWDISESDCFNPSNTSLMSRGEEEYSTCHRVLTSITDLPWTRWSECKQGSKRYRHRKIELDQEAIVMNFNDFVQFEACPFEVKTSSSSSSTSTTTTSLPVTTTIFNTTVDI